MARLERALALISGILLGIMLVLSIAQVATRYILTVSAPWTEELARLALVWAVFLGMAIGVSGRLHTRVEIFVDRLPHSARQLISILFDAIVGVLGIIMIVSGWQYTNLSWLDRSTTLGFPRGWFFLPVPVAGLLIVFSTFVHLVKAMPLSKKSSE